MRKTLLLAAALALPATASAQTWTTDRPGGTLVLKSCYVVKDGVRCDFTFSLTSEASSSIRYSGNRIKAVTPDGKLYYGTATSAGGLGFQTYGYELPVYRNVPVQLSVLFDLPNSTTSIKALAIDDEAMMNVPVARSAAATTPVVTTPAPSAAIPTGFSLALSDCKVNQGVYTCTAVLTPTR